MTPQRLNQLLLVMLVVGVAVATYFYRRGPIIETPPHALSWSRGEPDAGERSIDATWFGIDFVRLRDVDAPVLEQGALHRGDEWLVLEGVNCFDHFVPVDGGVFLLGEWCTEGGGDKAELVFLASDGGVTQVATLPKLVYFATLRGLTVEGDTLRITMDQDTEESVSLPDEWVFPPLRSDAWSWARPTARTFVTITSKNRGLSWQLDRFTEPP